MKTAALPAEIRPRVAQLVSFLGSDHDGEVVAAARALGRTLDSVGVDLSVLAAAIANPAEPIIVEQNATSIGTARHKRSRRQRQADRLSRAASDPHSSLTNWERDFVGSVTSALRSDAPLTEKQAVVLDRVLSKTRRRRS